MYILNYAPNYRDVFLRELGKLVDLIVVSFNAGKANLRDPENRVGYKYIVLKHRDILGMSLQYKEYTALNGDSDVIILGFDLHHPFRFLNLLRQKRVIFAGLIYGRNENSIITRFARRRIIPLAEGVLVYSDLVKNKLSREITKPIISFNNTSFSVSDIISLPFHFDGDELNLIWVGRFQKRKKIERLIDLARRDNRINLRLIGPGIKENISIDNRDKNIELYSEVYGNELTDHFRWSHAVFNSGGAGLMVMNAARFERPIFIDIDSHHGPEIQLAIEASQEFLNFGSRQEVDDLVDKCINEREYLINKGEKLASVMKEKYTVEYMAQQYFRAIKGEWL